MKARPAGIYKETEGLSDSVGVLKHRCVCMHVHQGTRAHPVVVWDVTPDQGVL